MMMPAINAKLYQALVAEMVKLTSNTPERRRLSALQRQLAEAQHAMLLDKTLDAWHKAG